MDDPSEYEGTIQRQEGALSAGVLEKLLEKAPDEPKFQHIDFGKEVIIEFVISFMSTWDIFIRVEVCGHIWLQCVCVCVCRFV